MAFFGRVHCPECGEKMPFGRIPNSLRQALWGGWTCGKCGCEMDRKGRKVPPAEGFMATAPVFNARGLVVLSCAMLSAGLGVGWLIFFMGLPEEFRIFRWFGWLPIIFSLLIFLVEAVILFRSSRGHASPSPLASRYLIGLYVWFTTCAWFISIPLIALISGMMLGGFWDTQDKMIEALKKQMERIEVLEKKVLKTGKKPHHQTRRIK